MNKVIKDKAEYRHQRFMRMRLNVKNFVTLAEIGRLEKCLNDFASTGSYRYGPWGSYDGVFMCNIVKCITELSKAGRLKFVTPTYFVMTKKVDKYISLTYDIRELKPNESWNNTFSFYIKDIADYVAYNHDSTKIDSSMLEEAIWKLYESSAHVGSYTHIMTPDEVKTLYDFDLKPTVITSYCKYCGTEFHGRFNGFAPQCPNCGGQVKMSDGAAVSME